MVSLGNAAVAGIIVGIFGISLLNPGGGIVALVVAGVILALYLTIPFVQEYVLSVNKGKAARKRPGSNDGSGGGGNGDTNK